MKPCLAGDNWTRDEPYQRCVEHGDLPMDHLSTDGDAWACKIWADEYGCNSCPEGTHSKPRTCLKLGEEIEVHGMIFVLTSISYGRPAKLTFEEKK